MLFFFAQALIGLLYDVQPYYMNPNEPEHEVKEQSHTCWMACKLDDYCFIELYDDIFLLLCRFDLCRHV